MSIAEKNAVRTCCSIFLRPVKHLFTFDFSTGFEKFENSFLAIKLYIFSQPVVYYIYTRAHWVASVGCLSFQVKKQLSDLISDSWCYGNYAALVQLFVPQYCVNTIKCKLHSHSIWLTRPALRNYINRSLNIIVWYRYRGTIYYYYYHDFFVCLLFTAAHFIMGTNILEILKKVPC